MLYLSLLFTANVAATDAGVAATNAASAASAVSTAAHIHPAAAPSTANAATTAIVVASASLLFCCFLPIFFAPHATEHSRASMNGDYGNMGKLFVFTCRASQ